MHFSRMGAIVKNAILYRFSKFKLHSIITLVSVSSTFMNFKYSIFFMDMFVRKKIGKSGRIVCT